MTKAEREAGTSGFHCCGVLAGGAIFCVSNASRSALPPIHRVVDTSSNSCRALRL